MRRVLPIVVLLLINAHVRAQSCTGGISVDPPNPTTETPVYLNFIGPGTDHQCQMTIVEISGFDVEVTTFFTCLFGSFWSNRHQSIGTLPAGTYSVRIYNPNVNGYLCGSFTVTAMPRIPTLSSQAQVLLAGLLALSGIATIRLRFGG